MHVLQLMFAVKCNAVSSALSDLSDKQIDTHIQTGGRRQPKTKTYRQTSKQTDET